jgi:hypothetical protein
MGPPGWSRVAGVERNMVGWALKPPLPAAALPLFGLLGLLSGSASGQTATPSPSPAGPENGDGSAASREEANPAPKRLRLDVERHVSERLARDRDVPRFETQVEVVGKSPQVMLNRFFGGVDLECGPAAAPPNGGAPSEVEMREARMHPSPTMDFAALAKAIADKLKRPGPDRYFLYRRTTRSRVSYELREGRLPASDLYLPGATHELVDAFPDLASGTKALRRMESGFASPRSPDAPPPAPWQTSTCRPR